jgi:hypothetical protein
MSPETPDPNILALRLERLADRLDQVEAQVRALVTSLIVDAREFVVRDYRGVIRARLEMEQHAPSLTFYDPGGKERLKVGLRTDGSPLLRVEQREISLG